MASIVKKIKKGRPYYYAVESARVNGKPRIVWQKYLGTLDSILDRADNKAEVKEFDLFEAGGVAAMLKIIDRIQLIEIIDQVIPKRNQGASVGQFIALAIINRVLAPCSKLKMSDWYAGTILARLWKYSSDTFTSQNFWQHMDLITNEHIEEIQKKIALQIKKEFKISSELLLYDTTNFFTYIATHNHRNTIAKRGRSKAKRNDLRQVGLAMLVTDDFRLPLFHRVYEGNRADRGIFPQVIREIKTDYKDTFGAGDECTIVFDKGNISEEGAEFLLVSKQHIVCAVPKNTVPEFFAIEPEQLKPVEDLAGTKACSCEIIIWDKTLKATLAYSESYFISELADLTERLQKCTKQLYDLDNSLSKSDKESKKPKPRSMESVKASVKEILTGGNVKELINVEFKTVNGISRIAFSVNLQKLDYLSKHELGRTLIITSRLEWSEKRIISAYRGQNAIETAFKAMKNQDYLHWQPAFHWTDQKIKVHGMYCVFALLVSSLAHKIVSEGGIDVSLLGMIEELNKIREVALICSESSQKRKKLQLVLSRMSSKQKAMADILEIAPIISR